MILRFVFAAVLLPSVLVIPGCGGELPRAAVAQVGTVLVSQAQFDQMEAAYEAAGRVPDKKRQAKDYRTFQQSLAQYLVTLEVLRQEAQDYGIVVTEKDVELQVADIQQMFQGDQERFAQALKKQKLTLEQLKESLRERLLLDEMKEAVTKDVIVAESEVKAYYNAHRGDYTAPEVRKVRHILIDPHHKAAQGEVPIIPTESDWQQARAEAEKVRSEILNGTDFGRAARTYSDDQETKDSGGELGSIMRGQMIPEFEEAAFGLKKDELSRPVRTEYGYHLIQVTDITPEAQMPYEQVKDKIRSALLASRKTGTWEAWLKAKQKELGVEYRSGFAPSKKVTATSTMIPLDTTERPAEPEPTGTTGSGRP